LKKYVVKLSEEERSDLLALTGKGKAGARRIKRAMILLAADDGAIDDEIVARLRVGARTVERVRKRFVEESLEAALSERSRLGKAPLLDRRQESHLIALACSSPPEGRAQWTMQLLANKLVQLGIVDTVSDETVRRALKRGTSSLGSTDSGASQA
jgi:transposase